MGYIWDLVKWQLGAFLVLFLLNLMFNEDFSQSRPFIYWGVWVVALIGAVCSWSERYDRNKKRRTVEEHQYQQAIRAKEDETVDSGPRHQS